MTTDSTAQFPSNYADSAVVAAAPPELFACLDKHSQLSAHMTRRSWMMGGGRMEITTDDGRFQRLGSRLRLAGGAFGLRLFLEEEITDYRPPRKKVWRTIGSPRLLIIGHYRMGFEVTPVAAGSMLRVFLDYDLPESPFARLLGWLLAPMYARWCVRNMILEGQKRFPAVSARQKKTTAP
jgi:hypothetical protein